MSSFDSFLLLYIGAFFSVMCRDFDGHYNAFVYMFQGFSFLELALGIAHLLFWSHSDMKDNSHAIFKVKGSAFFGVILTIMKLAPLLLMTDIKFIDFRHLCFSEQKAGPVEESFPALIVILLTLIQTMTAVPIFFVNRIRSNYERID